MIEKVTVVGRVEQRRTSWRWIRALLNERRVSWLHVPTAEELAISRRAEPILAPVVMVSGRCSKTCRMDSIHLNLLKAVERASLAPVVGDPGTVNRTFISVLIAMAVGSPLTRKLSEVTRPLGQDLGGFR